MSRKPSLWFLSEVYYPDEQGTAFYTTGLAEGLAKDFTVGVICSCPTVTARGTKVAWSETRNGVRIERCMGTTFNKDNITLRIVNMLTYSVAMFTKALLKINRGDIVFAVTSPPSSPFIAKVVCALRGAHCVLRLEDVYPEIAIATGLIRAESAITKTLAFLTKWLYRTADEVVVLGRDMQALAERKIGNVQQRARIIRSWADVDVVSPVPKNETPLVKELGLQEKFIVSCIGNMGRAQAMETLLEAATQLKAHPHIHFLFVGSGAKKQWMEDEIAARALTNITIIGQRPREDQLNFLNACDISLISLLPGVTGAGVPSRTYNIMAAGKPIIAVTEPHSEVALLAQEERIGWVCHPAKPDEVVAAIREAAADLGRIEEMGKRAAATAKERFSRETVVGEYRTLVRSLAGLEASTN